MKGRKPKPTALKLLEGNPGKRPLPKSEPKPVPIAPKCPAWLHKDAKKEWKRIAPQLERLGLLTSLDMTSLAGYCQAYARYKEAEEFLNKRGTAYAIWDRDQDGSIKYDDKGQPILKQMHPWPQAIIASKMLQQIKSFCAEFGFTPSARSRMSVPGSGKDDDSMEALLSGVDGQCISSRKRLTAR